VANAFYIHRSVASGLVYDEPNGDLLVWLNLGGRRRTSNWPGISVVNLTLVVTVYKKECTRPRQGYRQCGDRSRCIHADYFCDGHFNCATDRIPDDEDGCVELQHEREDKGNEDSSSKDLDAFLKRSIYLAMVVAIISVTCLCGYCLRACSRVGENEPSAHREPLSLDELHRRRHNAATTEENVYLPLGAGGMTTSLNDPPPRPSPDDEEEPPPAYEALFPSERRPELEIAHVRGQALEEEERNCEVTQIPNETDVESMVESNQQCENETEASAEALPTSMAAERPMESSQ